MAAPTFSPVREYYQAQDGGDAGGGRENDVFERIRRHLPPSDRITLNKMFQTEMFLRIVLKSKLREVGYTAHDVLYVEAMGGRSVTPSAMMIGAYYSGLKGPLGVKSIEVFSS